MEHENDGLLKNLIYLLLLIIFMVFSFYLIANVLHYKSVRKTIYKDENDLSYVEFSNNLSKLKNTMDNVNVSITDTQIKRLYNGINLCVTSIDSIKIIDIYNDKLIDYKDLYNLFNSFESGIINGCLVSNLGFILSSNNDYLGYIAPYLNMQFSSLSRESAFVRNELLGNSEYYFDLSNNEDSYGNDLENVYGIILNNYNMSLKILLELANYMNGGV